MLKLPKSLNDHPHRELLEAFLAAGVAPLYDGARSVVTHKSLDAAIGEALQAAFGTGHLVQGLELIDTRLANEAKGLSLARLKTGQARPERLSRLLILANDGTERFYRDADGLLVRHNDRLWGLKLDATGAALGAALTAKGGPAKALLIDDKDAVGLAFSRLAERLASKRP